MLRFATDKPVPVNESSAPVRKWYQIDFSPAAFCKRVFQSVCTEPPTRSDSRAQKAYVDGGRDVIGDLKTEVFRNTTEESVLSTPTEQETRTPRAALSPPKPPVDPRVWKGAEAAFVTQDGNLSSANEHMMLAEDGPCFSLGPVSCGSADHGTYTCAAKNSGVDISCAAKEMPGKGSRELEREISTVVKGNRKRRSLQSLSKEEVGRGLFGVVRRILSGESSRNPAGTFPPPKRSSRIRALQEGDLLSCGARPRAAFLLDHFCSWGLLADLCSSRGLLDHLLSKGTVEEKEVGTYIQQVLEGIEHIHSLNILHLDINPTNIVMALEKEAVKICDFGFAQKIDPSRCQYCHFGTPEFVAPEIVCHSSVTKGTDIWSLGVLAYLCVTCRCPFAGESGGATLLSVRNGTVSWDAADVTSRSWQAQDFLRRTLQPEPALRPSAAECLRHRWFQRLHGDLESAYITTKNLAFFMSRGKFQRSLTCCGSALVLRTIPELLAASPQDTSVTGPQNPQGLDSPSLSSGFSSEHDEMGALAMPLATPLLQSLHADRENGHPETKDPDSEPSNERVASETPGEEGRVEVEAAGRRVMEERHDPRGGLAREWPELAGQLMQGDGGSAGVRVPRESLIRSTFYSSSEELSPLSARRMLMCQKKRIRRLECSRARLRSGFLSGIGEPLLEHVEDIADEDSGGSHRRDSSQSSAPLTKSCSFDGGPLPYLNTRRQERRSRSLDEFLRRTPSASELRESGEDVNGKDDVLVSREILGQDQEAVDVVEDLSLKKDKELIVDEVVETDVPRLALGDGVEATELEYIANDALYLSEVVKATTVHVSFPERFDDGICKPSDLASFAPEQARGFKHNSTKELVTAGTTAQSSFKRADSIQELFLCVPQDEEHCDFAASVQYSLPEPKIEASGLEEDYGMVESAVEVYPGLFKDEESCGYLASSQSSLTNLFDRVLEEVCGRAEVYPGPLVYSEERSKGLEETMFESSSGKESYVYLQSYEVSDPELKDSLEEVCEDHCLMAAGKTSGLSYRRTPGEGDGFLTKPGSLNFLHRGSVDIQEELQRYPSTPTLEAKSIAGKSGEIIEFFRRDSWTSQSSLTERALESQESDERSSDSLQQQQQKPPDLSIAKRVKASVSRFSRAVLGRQTSKEDKKDGAEMKGCHPFPHRKSPEAGGGSPKKSPGLFSFKLPGFKRSKGPVFMEELADRAVLLGQEVTLRCRASGHPFPEVQWYKEARRLETTDQIRLAVTDREFLHLTIYSAREEDLGGYRCVVSNPLGQASTCCTLVVSELPTCPTGLQAYQLQGDGVLLVWRPVEFITDLTYCIEYSRDGRGWRLLAEGMADSSYVAGHLATGVQYEFRVACLNMAGRGPFSNASAPTLIGAEEKGSQVPLVYTESLGPRELMGQARFSPSALHQTYTFFSEINRGRYSVVKQCREDFGGQLLASKITPLEPQWRQRALGEYQLLRGLSHAHLVQLHAAFVTPCYLVLILELCPGRELLHHLAERVLYGEVHVQALLQQILSVASYLHRRRIAHLDLNSHNMLVTEQSQLKLVDLGSARVFTPGRPIFTQRLMDLAQSEAPEVLKGQGVGPETDIWAIGVLAFIMLNAEEPFAEGGHDVRKAKLVSERCRSGLSNGALDFMERALNSMPQARPSAAECLQLPWIRGACPPSEPRDVVARFTTDKLRSFLQERDMRRHRTRGKMEAPVFP
ncbi:hypothetical protein AAFF_G00264480 [Aldrovandia affinis]|uniref:Uncharacterized protein n=1 Tax=Aldrovandia affinis TaxID=143900 RepID=A0AAD7STA6_9TELE|nr:hypothetical protein AAFF_G00264480 [Aldrovandia affinis]